MYVIEPLKASDNDAHAVFKYESLEKEGEIPKTCGAIHSSGKSDESIKMTSKIFDTPEEVSLILNPQVHNMVWEHGCIYLFLNGKIKGKLSPRF